MTFQASAKPILKEGTDTATPVAVEVKSLEVPVFKMFTGPPENIKPQQPSKKTTSDDEDEGEGDEGEGDEDEDDSDPAANEAMLLHSLINMQLEGMKKTMIPKDISYTITDKHCSPQWLQCFGLAFSAPKFSLFEGGVHAFIPYHPIKADPGVCENFREIVTKEGNLVIPSILEKGPIDSIVDATGMSKHASSINSVLESHMGGGSGDQKPTPTNTDDHQRDEL